MKTETHNIVRVRIDADFTLENLDDFTAVSECVSEALDKLREQGKAGGTLVLEGKIGVEL